MTPNLLPCPFCGEPASHGNGFSPCESIVYAWCSNNDCQLHLIDHYGFTPETWNTRAKAAPTEPQSDAVIVPRELLDRFPEINMANFGADEVNLLNDWGIEVSLLGGDHE